MLSAKQFKDLTSKITFTKEIIQTDLSKHSDPFPKV